LHELIYKTFCVCFVLPDVNFKTKKTLYTMYDKRYTPDQIKRERWWAGFNMFFIMALLCWGIGKVTYKTGYHDGYRAHMLGAGAMQQEQPVEYKVQKASFEIEVISEANLSSQQINHPGCWKCQLRNGVNWIIKYWMFGLAFLVLLFLANWGINYVWEKDYNDGHL
jgi:hypothetical protein